MDNQGARVEVNEENAGTERRSSYGHADSNSNRAKRGFDLRPRDQKLSELYANALELGGVLIINPAN
jgi:hypothetical protein